MRTPCAESTALPLAPAGGVRHHESVRLTLHRWSDADLGILRRANSPEMTEFLGGPEADEDIVARHEEYLSSWDEGSIRMFRVEVDGETAGYAGWWSEEHEGAPVYEIGCAVEPPWQGRGVATEALREVVRLSALTPDPRPVVGYAPADNPASNALCRSVGFALAGSGVFPGDDGTDLSVNVWLIDPR